MTAARKREEQNETTKRKKNEHLGKESARRRNHRNHLSPHVISVASSGKTERHVVHTLHYKQTPCKALCLWLVRCAGHHPKSTIIINPERVVSMNLDEHSNPRITKYIRFVLFPLSDHVRRLGRSVVFCLIQRFSSSS